MQTSVRMPKEGIRGVIAKYMPSTHRLSSEGHLEDISKSKSRSPVGIAAQKMTISHFIMNHGKSNGWLSGRGHEAPRTEA